MITTSVGRPRLVTAPRADAAKVRALVCSQPRVVPLQRLGPHIALQHVECGVEHEPRGLGAESLAATLTDRDGELGCAVGIGDLEQAGGADRCGVGAVVDRELDGFGLASRPSRCSPPPVSWLCGVAMPR